MSDGSDSSSRSISHDTVFSPMPSMSIPPREAKWTRRAQRCAGQRTSPMQRATTSPSGRTTGLLQTGHLSGMTNSRSSPVRTETTGPTTSGITSPARRTITVSPMRMSLRRTSSSLCNVASETVAPETRTGSSMAKGVAAPVRPMLTMMSLSLVVRSSGGNL